MSVPRLLTGAFAILPDPIRAHVGELGGMVDGVAAALQCDSVRCGVATA